MRAISLIFGTFFLAASIDSYAKESNLATSAKLACRLPPLKSSSEGDGHIDIDLCRRYGDVTCSASHSEALLIALAVAAVVDGLNAV